MSFIEVDSPEQITGRELIGITRGVGLTTTTADTGSPTQLVGSGPTGVTRKVIVKGLSDLFINKPDNTSPIVFAEPVSGIVVVIPSGLSRVQTKVVPGSQ